MGANDSNTDGPEILTENELKQMSRHIKLLLSECEASGKVEDGIK